MKAFLLSGKRSSSSLSAVLETAPPTAVSQPTSFASWNCNGLSVRLQPDNRNQKEEFFKFLQRERPDVLTLQEVRMKCGGKRSVPDQTKRAAKATKSDYELYNELKATLEKDYTIKLTLASSKYAGQAVFIRKGIQLPDIYFNMALDRTEHDSEGRVIVAEFDSCTVLSTYTPNNGTSEESFCRRRAWDDRLLTFLLDRKHKSLKPIIYLGDLNVAATEHDVSGDLSWWLLQCNVTSRDRADHGQPGCTVNERVRFSNICDRAELVDPWRFQHPVVDPIRDKNINFPLYTWRGSQGKYYAKGMRIDYILVSKEIMDGGLVESTVIYGTGPDRHGFCGSDHCPVLLRLRPDWWISFSLPPSDAARMSMDSDSASNRQGAEASGIIISVADGAAVALHDGGEGKQPPGVGNNMNNYKKLRPSLGEDESVVVIELVDADVKQTEEGY